MKDVCEGVMLPLHLQLIYYVFPSATRRLAEDRPRNDGLDSALPPVTENPCRPPRTCCPAAQAGDREQVTTHRPLGGGGSSACLPGRGVSSLTPPALQPTLLRVVPSGQALLKSPGSGLRQGVLGGRAGLERGLCEGRIESPVVWESGIRGQATLKGPGWQHRDRSDPPPPSDLKNKK